MGLGAISGLAALAKGESPESGAPASEAEERKK
jgi:hypothetical protein